MQPKVNALSTGNLRVMVKQDTETHIHTPRQTLLFHAVQRAINVGEGTKAQHAAYFLSNISREGSRRGCTWACMSGIGGVRRRGNEEKGTD